MPRSLALKKSVVAGERERPDVARRRAQWIKYQDRVEPERLVFIDETWTRTDMAPLRGWAPRGCRLTATVPHGCWKTMTSWPPCAQQNNLVALHSAKLNSRKVGWPGAAEYVGTLDRGVEALLGVAQEGDAVLTLGAGSVWQAGEKVLARLRPGGGE